MVRGVALYVYHKLGEEWRVLSGDAVDEKYIDRMKNHFSHRQSEANGSEFKQRSYSWCRLPEEPYEGHVVESEV